MAELEETLAIPREEVILASAKEGTGVDEILEAIVKRDPAARAATRRRRCRRSSSTATTTRTRAWSPTSGSPNGTLHDHERIRFMATGVETEILELGYFRPQPVPTERLAAGEVGYVATGLKSIADARVGDTLTDGRRGAAEPAARLPAGAAARLRRHLPDARRRLPAPARRARQAAPQRRRLRLRARVAAWRWASASAAASSACCTWRSSRSAWSASSGWT